MMKWEQTKHYATVGIYGICGLIALTLAMFGKGGDYILSLAFISLALVEMFSARSRQATPRRKKSVKSQIKSEIKEHNEYIQEMTGVNARTLGSIGFKQAKPVEVEATTIPFSPAKSPDLLEE
jgi:hypothetical protein